MKDLIDLPESARLAVEDALRARTKTTAPAELPKTNFLGMVKGLTVSRAVTTNHLPGCPLCGALALMGRGSYQAPFDIEHDCNCVADQPLAYARELRRVWTVRQAVPLYLGNVPPLFQSSQLTDPELGSEGRAAALAAAQRLDGSNLYLWGLPGRRKTHLATALGRAYAEKGMRVRWYSTNKLIADYRAVVTGGPRPTPEDYDVLILDDPGKVKPTAYAFEAMFNVLDHAHTHRQTLIVTAQDRPGVIAGAITPEDANEGAAAAVASRLGSGRVIEVTGRDERYNSANA